MHGRNGDRILTPIQGVALAAALGLLSWAVIILIVLLVLR